MQRADLTHCCRHMLFTFGNMAAEIPKSFEEGALPVQLKVRLEWLRQGCLPVYALQASGKLMEFRACLYRLRQRCL